MTLADQPPKMRRARLEVRSVTFPRRAARACWTIVPLDDTQHKAILCRGASDKRPRFGLAFHGFEGLPEGRFQPSKTRPRRIACACSLMRCDPARPPGPA